MNFGDQSAFHMDLKLYSEIRAGVARDYKAGDFDAGFGDVM